MQYRREDIWVCQHLKKKIAYNRGKKNIKTEDLKNFTSDLCEVDAANVVLT